MKTPKNLLITGPYIKFLQRRKECKAIFFKQKRNERELENDWLI